MSDAPISVIVPTCNRPDRLRDCLLAVFAQAAGTIDHVIVADDGHQDARAVVDALNAPVPVTVLRCGGIGPAAARNQAIGQVQTPYAAFLDDDSFAEPGWAEYSCRLFREFPEVTAQLGRILWAAPARARPSWRTIVPRSRQRIYDSRDVLYRDPVHTEALAQALGRTVPAGLPGLAPHLSGGNSGVRMAFFEEHGVFEPSLRTLSDRELAWRILATGGLIAYNPEMVVRHCHDPSLMRALRRCYRTVPYEKRLAGLYPSRPWERNRGDGRIALTPLPVKLRLDERVYLWLVRMVRSLAYLRPAKRVADPLARTASQ